MKPVFLTSTAAILPYYPPIGLPGASFDTIEAAMKFAETDHVANIQKSTQPEKYSASPLVFDILAISTVARGGPAKAISWEGVDPTPVHKMEWPSKT